MSEKKPPTERANDGLRAQFYGTMQNILTRVDLSHAPDTAKALHARAHELLFPDESIQGEKRGWNRAYAVEKMLAHLRPAFSLRAETRTQIDTLKRMGHPAADKYEQQFSALYPDEAGALDLSRAADPADAFRWGDARTEEARELLERVLNDVHWTAAQRYHKRGIIDRYTERIAHTGMAVTALFVATLVAIGLTGIALSPWAGVALVIVSGLLGAVFSILINSATRDITATIEDLLRRTSPPVIWLRLSVGAISAVILYFFFEAGLVEGLLFPELETLGFAPIGFGPPSAATLAEAITQIRVEALRAAPSVQDLAAAEPAAAAVQELLDQIYTRAAASPGPEETRLADLTALHAELRDLATRATQAAAALPSSAPEAGAAQAALDRVLELTQTDGRRRLGGYVPNAALCKLIVWSFLAGFSEQLVARMLRRVERGTETKSSG